MNPAPDRPDRCAEDVAAYALGALEAAEAEAFRAHLRTCPVCPSELAAFRQVVDELAAGAPVRPAPRQLRRRVMRAVADEPRLDAAARRARQDRNRPWIRVPRPGLTLPGAGLVAAAIAVIVVLATGSGGSSRTYAARVVGSGTAAVHVSGDHGQLVVHDFAAAPRGEIYEVWLQRGRSYRSTTALFGVTRDGDASVEVPGDLKGVSHILVTAEPAGGTRQPTHPPVIDATLG
jgi:anti-sigma factor RsiW